MKSLNPFLFTLVAIALLTGCSPRPGPAAAPKATSNRDAAFSAPTQLTAVSTNGNNILVTWKNNATADGGVWVEYTTPGSDYIQLDAFPSDSDETSFVHPDLAPHTTFLYRLMPFFGRPTKPIEITTGTASPGEGSNLPSGPIDPTNNVAFDRDQKFSIRKIKTFAQAMPSDLTATLSSPTSVDLHWKDHSEDEEGYLLEVSAQSDGAFVPCALLPANTTSFRKTMLPPQTKCYFRVRAFFYGKPTEPVSAITSTR